MSRVLVWFSCGAASAVAAKMAIEEHGDAVEVVLCDTLASEHTDNRRFLEDCERWFGRRVTIIRSSVYASVDDVFERTRYMSGIAGARCTVEMKKRPREEYQRPGDLHVFGFTAEERKRAEDFDRRNTSVDTWHVLVERLVTKRACLDAILEARIALPAMYSLGFEHNNCIGCVKATSPGYWNRVRRHFPDVFERRSAQSRTLGVKLARLGSERVFLDTLPADADAPDDSIECGVSCQLGFDFMRGEAR